MSGKYYTTLLHNLFGFPCTRTCRNIKSKYKQQHGIDESIFNGSNESIIKLINLFWESIDTRYIISVDAAAVNSKLTVHKNGRIEGLMNELTIEKDLVELITKDPDEFHKFYDEHREEIVKYYFVFYACSLDENAKSFPLALKRKQMAQQTPTLQQIWKNWCSAVKILAWKLWEFRSMVINPTLNTSMRCAKKSKIWKH